ncbi:MAG: cytochrome c [Chloroflexota bacterium]|nr:cytochrome c [Chloroflexota bacterium]
MLQRLIFERIEQRILVGTLSFLAIMVLVGWIAINEGGRMAAFETQYLARSIERGAYLYMANCSTCHGTDGLGGAGRAPALNSPYLFGHDYLADLNREQSGLEREKLNSATTQERITEIDARLAEIETERNARLSALAAATETPGDYNPEAPSRLSNLGWTGSLRSFLLTTLIHGRPNSIQYWGGNQMVAWGQLAGGPLRTDQLEDLTNFILNWDKGDAWTTDDALAVRQWPISVVDVALAGPPRETIAPAGTDPSTLDLSAINAEVANFQGDPQNGQSLYNGTLGCAGCHLQAAVAPPMEGTWTRVTVSHAPLAGLEPTEYLVHSILYPGEFLAPGEPYIPGTYPNAMLPNYSERLTYQELADLIAYLQTQDQEVPGL